VAATTGWGATYWLQVVAQMQRRRAFFITVTVNNVSIVSSSDRQLLDIARHLPLSSTDGMKK